MNLVDKAFLRWQMLNQPRRFRQSLAAAGEQLVCALSPVEREASAAAARRHDAPAPAANGAVALAPG
ncbi:MAG: hypothetical protein R3C60_05035 [Parvularculaceae bacterium]